MSRVSAPPHPQCHPGQVSRPGPDGRTCLTAVWVCEYPYRTLRTEGPSADCAGCPVWTRMERARHRGGATGAGQDVGQSLVLTTGA